MRENAFEERPIGDLPGVGKVKQALFAKLDIDTLGALLRHFPRDYQDRSRITPVYELSHGDRTTVGVYITGAANVLRRPQNRSITRVPAADSTGRVTLVFFNQPYRADQLHKGDFVYAYGTADCAYGSRTLVPEDVTVSSPEADLSSWIKPFYPATAGLGSGEISRFVIRALQMDDAGMIDPLPADLVKKYKMPDAFSAARMLHCPTSMDEITAARRRFAYEELFTLSAGLALLKKKRIRAKGQKLDPVDLDPFYSALPYAPTTAQRRSICESAEDMCRGECPMNRLLQGDVGSGKTTVAAALFYFVAKNGKQSAMMAPTEILAEQHYKTLAPLLGKFGITVALLTGSTSAAARRDLLENCEDGTISLLVGTHAVLEDRVAFKDLALTVCDEQHRFGVRQRSALVGKADTVPHTLMMSATPIPRTLALIMYGDMDVSVLDELPPGRKEIKTYSVGEEMRPRILNFMRKTVGEGHQVYVVCPLIEDEEGEQDLKPVTAYCDELQTKHFPDLIVKLLHGKMKPGEKDEIMRDFRDGKIHILVSTTVIEVGVDVPNATLMVVENAERFGLSQLHQLRGRVGRGKDQSYCVLMNHGGEVADRRMQVLCDTNDGFRVAKEDLELRGPGDFFGSRQHGIPALSVASLQGDSRMLYAANEDAAAVLKVDPDLSMKEHADLRYGIRRMFAKTGNGELFMTL